MIRPSPPALPHRATLLVVDDEPINIQTLSTAFRGDHRVLVATSGAQALKICRTAVPDLVLLDVNMPGMDGFEVCRRLKEDTTTGGIPVIFVTASHDEQREVDGLALGAVDFIGKPVSAAIVRARVKTHLDLRKATAALIEFNETLESRIHARTGELELAMHAADAANRAKSAFLSNMSHEIRTPINGVVGMTYLALRADPPAEQRAFLTKISDCGRHLLEIVTDILDYSKIEAGKLTLEETRFDWSDICAGISCQLADAAAAKSLALVFDRDPALDGAFLGDPLRIGQVLINFVGNAIKFSQAGEVRIRMHLASTCEQVHTILLEVIDKGLGMTASQIAELFQPFHQADTSTTRRFGGTGLGLAICGQLATLMGGEVGVRSKSGRGSTFWFKLPLRRASLLQGGPGRALDDRPPSAERSLRGARILVAEDNLINRELAIGLLEAGGALVTTARNGEEAVSIARGAPFDLILMDVQMPVMDGLQATRILRSDPATAVTPILALTANAGQDDLAMCLEAGMDDFLTKPIVPADLYEFLGAWLRRRPITAKAAPADVAPLPASCQPPQAIDLSILSTSVGHNPTLFAHLARAFRDSVAGVCTDLEQALANRDMGALSMLGHRLKSSSKMVGASGVAVLCEALESMRGDGSLPAARDVVQQVQALLAQIHDDIGRRLA